MTALNALALVNLAIAILIISDSADRASLVAWALEMNDSPVRAGTCAHSALFTLRGINVHPDVSGMYRIKFT